MSTALALPEFIARWQGSTLSERSAAQSHFIELCQVVGKGPTRARALRTAKAADGDDEPNDAAAPGEVERSASIAVMDICPLSVPQLPRFGPK